MAATKGNGLDLAKDRPAKIPNIYATYFIAIYTNFKSKLFRVASWMAVAVRGLS